MLQKHFDLNKPGNVLEISSGTGQHSSYFAEHFPNLTFYPTEYDTSLFPSIKAYAEETPTKNVKDPIKVDITTSSKTWNLGFSKCDYLININMMHISPFNCTEGLFRNAGNVLKAGGLMVTYGPYAHNGVITPQSNVNFNKGLKSQNSEWGLRDINVLEKLAEQNSLKLIQIYDLPSNNKCLVFKNERQNE